MVMVMVFRARATASPIAAFAAAAEPGRYAFPD